MMQFYINNARWLVGGFLLTMSSAFGQTFFISIFGSEIREQFDLSHGGFGAVYMVATLASALCFPFVGKVVDKTSVASCSAVVIIMLTLATFSMSFISSLPLLIATIFLLRLFGQGMMGHVAMVAMGRWYSDNRGKAISFAAVGGQVGEAAAPIIFATLAIALGWRMAWSVAGIYLLLILPIIWGLMKTERVPKSQMDADNAKTEIGHQWTQGEVLRDPLFWLVASGVMSPAFIGTSIWFHQDYLIDLYRWSETTYYASFSLMAATTFTVSLMTGFAIDRWSAVQIVPFFMAPLGVACFILGTQSAIPAIFATMVAIGISYGLSSPIFSALWPEVYGTRHLGAVRALVMAFMVFSSAAGPGITGLLIDAGVPFPRQLIFIGIYCLLSFVVMIFVSRRYHARRLAQSNNTTEFSHV